MGKKVIDNINDYIEVNGVSLKALSQATGILYNTLWKMFHKNNDISLDDYISICKVLDKPLDFFIPKK